MRSLAYRMFTVIMHPALGGVTLFTLIGLVFHIPADPLAIYLAGYVVFWALVTDIMNYFGWHKSH